MKDRINSTKELWDSMGEEAKNLNPGLAEHTETVKRNKHGNIPTEANGILFQSGREAVRAGELQIMLRAGRICNLCYQVNFDISPPGHHGQPMIYRADFVYIELPAFRVVVEDVKPVQVPGRPSYRTKEYRIKKKLFEAKYPIKITEV